jgi:hypothetical protein
MPFNINNQHAGGNINNVEGDLYVTGGQHGVLITVDDARQAARALRTVVRAAPLGTDAATAAHEVEEIEVGLAAPQPDRSRLATALERLTRLLGATGALATAGAALVAPLQTLAAWLGPMGAPVLGLLAAFG